MADGNMPAQKTCTKCGQTKALDDFRLRPANTDGRAKACKACDYQQRIAWAASRPGWNKAQCLKWRSENLEKSRELDRKRYPNRRDAERERRKKAWAALTPDERRQKADSIREWREANPELVSAMDRRNRTNNRETHSKRMARWRKNNPDAAAAIRDRRRAKAVGAAGDYTKDDVRALLKSQGRVCRYCDHVLTKFHVDHFIPLARGGSNGPENLVLACPPCNLSKGAKLPSEWMPERFPPP